MRARLSALYFLQFAVWGCYLTCFGQFLGAGGLGADIAWFYAAIGLVSILTPPILGRLADRTGRPETLAALCHLTAALFMFLMWRYGMTHKHLEFRILYPLYLAFLAFYMPTMALVNTATFGLLTHKGKSLESSFPSIRIWGTVGFVAAMWFVNSAYWHEGSFGFTFTDTADSGHLRFQYNAMQLLCSALTGIVAAVYILTLPRCRKEVGPSEEKGNRPKLYGSLRDMFGKRETALFLLFVIFAGVCLQISNGFATPFLTHFSGIACYAESFASGNATMLFSLSQISEAACVLLVGISLRKGGIRMVYAIGLLAWSVRFLTLSLGNPGGGLWLLVCSMMVYGVAFNFITISGHMYIQKVAPSGMKGLAQGVMMLMSNGIGATFGTLAAGAIVNHWCGWQSVTIPGNGSTVRLFMGEWEWPWLIFSLYALAIMLLWLLCYRGRRRVYS